MENARVYQVGNVSSVSFDDAFGDYSNAGGRERRKKRKLERIEARREVKAARIAARNEAKASRQEARQGRKLARKERRQEMRQQRVSARAQRRGTKVGARLERRGLRTDLRGKRRAMRKGDSEMEMDDQTATETGASQQQPSYQEPQQQDAQQQYQEEDTQSQQGGGYAPSEEEDNGYNQPTSQDYGDEESYQEEDQQEEGAAEGTDADLDQSGEGGDETGFDGTGSSSVIDPKLLEVANKIEWNDELIERLWDKVDESYRLGRAVDNIEKVIDAREERISQLEGELDSWCNADGLSPKQVDARRRKVEKARAEAKRNRNKATRRPVPRALHGGSETPVETELNPEFAPNKIVIPAEEKSPATGLNGLDLIDDFDAPDTRFVELSSNASGITKKPINWGNVMFGIVLGGVVIYALKKYKVLDKI